MLLKIKNLISIRLVFLLIAAMIAVGFTGCQSKKKLARQQAAKELAEKIEKAKKDLLMVINDQGAMSISQKEKIVDDVKALNLNNEEVDALIIEAEKAIERHKKLEAQRLEEERLRKEREAAEQRKIEEQKFDKMEDYFDAIASASTIDIANMRINDALKFFASPEVPVLIITYGGMSGRDMNALAQGLYEGTEFDYLDTRIRQVAYLGQRITDFGITVQKPYGGHAIFVDAKRFLPQIPKEEFPAQTLAVELYLEGGVRGVEIGALLADRDPVTRENRYPELELLRLTIPRRVYTNNHMNYVAVALANVWEKRDKIKSGMKIISEAPIMRHFTVELTRVNGLK